MQKFSGKEEENMKRQNGVRAGYDTFLSRALQASFGCSDIFNTLNEAYLLPSIVLHRHHFASFTKAR